ncbi:unnamed protein product [Thlaspi arvense]|uniref:Uncharacterized protein n=1 Tax=Thlaspi arvense TaxID=13288 RepID=A0AAU9S7K3_THLAR|nr:unnamed protein product [Thlaspi arvense]
MYKTRLSPQIRGLNLFKFWGQSLSIRMQKGCFIMFHGNDFSSYHQ